MPCVKSHELEDSDPLRGVGGPWYSTRLSCPGTLPLPIVAGVVNLTTSAPLAAKPGGVLPVVSEDSGAVHARLVFRTVAGHVPGRGGGIVTQLGGVPVVPGGHTGGGGVPQVTATLAGAAEQPEGTVTVRF